MLMKKIIGPAACLLLVACASAPTAPSVMVLPGSGRSFDSFRADDDTCRHYALEQTGGSSAQQRGREAAVTSAAAGTAIGAVAGAAIGGQQGAAVGAGSGLIVGSAVGVDSARQAGYGTQRQYDNAYIQCMYAKGHRVPVPANMARSHGSPPPEAPTGTPPPPAGTPPAPPPDVRR
jgi:hypothetical protein